MDSPESALRDANRLESTGDLSAAEAVLDRACRKLNVRSGKALAYLDKWESAI